MPVSPAESPQPVKRITAYEVPVVAFKTVGMVVFPGLFERRSGKIHVHGRTGTAGQRMNGKNGRIGKKVEQVAQARVTGLERPANFTHIEEKSGMLTAHEVNDYRNPVMLHAVFRGGAAAPYDFTRTPRGKSVTVIDFTPVLNEKPQRPARQLDQRGLNGRQQFGRAIEDAAVSEYCGNYTVNLILSAYIAKAEHEKINVETQIDLPENSPVSDMDLCVIFANALENATNACKKLTNDEDRRLNILCKNKDGKLFIQITNTYDGLVNFVDHMPVRAIEDHGLGIKSIAAVAEKYGGLCSFEAADGMFCASMILQPEQIAMSST